MSSERSSAVEVYTVLSALVYPSRDFKGINRISDERKPEWERALACAVEYKTAHPDDKVKFEAGDAQVEVKLGETAAELGKVWGRVQWNTVVNRASYQVG